MGFIEHVRMFPVDKSTTTETEQIYSRSKVPLLKPEQREKRGTNNDDLSKAKINLFQIENLDIKNGILRNLMIKPISTKKK